jgi:hypothetical protein
LVVAALSAGLFISISLSLIRLRETLAVCALLHPVGLSNTCHGPTWFLNHLFFCRRFFNRF